MLAQRHATGFRIERSGLFVRDRPEHRQVVLVGQRHRLVEVLLGFPVSSADACPGALNERVRRRVIGRRLRRPFTVQRQRLAYRASGGTGPWRGVDLAERGDHVVELHDGVPGHAVDVLHHLIDDRGATGVVAGPEIQPESLRRDRTDGDLIALQASGRHGLPLVESALTGQQERILAAAHQIEADLLNGLAQQARHGL